MALQMLLMVIVELQTESWPSEDGILRDELRDYVVEHLGSMPRGLVVEDSGLL